MILAAEYEQSLEESGEGWKTGLEKGRWKAKDSPEKIYYGMWMCGDCYLCFDRYSVGSGISLLRSSYKKHSLHSSPYLPLQPPSEELTLWPEPQ